jgi:microsomal dipeptidase-like Zn-dependent dipeptidase/CubicO group peptidase (beta-lactamase class C family)
VSARIGALLLALSVAAPAGAAGRAAPAPLTLDTHVDIPDAYMREARFDAGRNSVLQVDLGKMERGGLDAAFFVIFVEQGPLTADGYAKAVATAENKYNAIESLVARNRDRSALATSPDQVLSNHAAGKLSAMIGIENGYSLGHDLGRLDAAWRRGARYLGLVHVGNNDLCTSSMPDAKQGESNGTGLTEFGRSAVIRANELGMMVDVSHASDACVLDVLEVSTRPLIASHSSARALVDHARNLSDPLLRAIARKGGVVQAVAYKEFLKSDPDRAAAEKLLEAEIARQAGAKEFDGEQHGYLPAYLQGMAGIQEKHPLATLEQYVDHIEYMVKLVGIDHVGIASDFDGGGGITGWMDASQTGNVTAALRKRGFSEADIGKLWSGNLLRVWRGAGDGRASIDTIVDEAVARFHLPGIAVGVIENGVVTYAGTRGETRVGSGRPITRETLFKIASNSKAMTASVLARLVQAGKLRWDDPVKRHLPAFRMFDPWVTENMRVADLLVHNSGLPEGGGDLMLWPDPNDFTRADILNGLGYIKPAYGFRAGYAYDNLLYVVAGEVAAAAGGASYEELLRREVFAPLGLSRCRVGEFTLAEAGSVAQPHGRRDGRNVAVDGDAERVREITSAAAGGVRCSLDDMLAWAGNWLHPDARQLAWLSQERRQEMWQPRTPMPIGARRRAWDATHYYAYAYGFRVADADGEWTVSHTGTLNGMYSVMMLLPDRDSGFVVMINGDGDAARTVLTEVLLKYFTSPGNAKPLSFYADALAAESKAPARAASTGQGPRKPLSATSMPGAPGIYRDPWFGEARVCSRGGKVRFESAKSPLLAGTVELQDGKPLVNWDSEDVDVEAWLAFSAPGPGQPARMTMSKTDPEADFSFDFEDLAFERIRDCD